MEAKWFLDRTYRVLTSRSDKTYDVVHNSPVMVLEAIFIVVDSFRARHTEEVAALQCLSPSLFEEATFTSMGFRDMSEPACLHARDCLSSFCSMRLHFLG